MSRPSSSSSSSSSSSNVDDEGSVPLGSAERDDLMDRIASGIRTRRQTRSARSQPLAPPVQPRVVAETVEADDPEDDVSVRVTAMEPLVQELRDLLPALRSLLSTPQTLSSVDSPSPSTAPAFSPGTSVGNLAIAIFAREATRIDFPQGKEDQLEHCHETIFRTLRMALDKTISWTSAAKLMSPSIMRLLQYFLVDRSSEKEEAWTILGCNKVTISRAAETVSKSWLDSITPELDRPEDHLLQDALSLAADQISDRLNLRRPKFRGGRFNQEGRPTAASPKPFLLQIQQPASAPQTTVPTLASDPQITALLSALQSQIRPPTANKKRSPQKRQRK